MIVDLSGVPPWVVERVRGCGECRVGDGDRVVVCGWHESLVAAALIVASTGGVVVREDEPLPVLLRRFADRALVCWEGSDVDLAVKVMCEAADRLEGL